MRNSLTIISICISTAIFSYGRSQDREDIQNIVVVTPKDCLLLQEHIPDDDVTYKPSVDVRGNSIIPAEIKNGNRLDLGAGGYSFYMTHDALKDNQIAKEYGLSDAQEGKIILGRVSIQESDIYWNGASLKNSERNHIYALCRETSGGKKRAILKR
jgi:hypothetical protein